LAAELADFIGTESWDEPLSRLSDREFTVLRHIVSGMSMKEIAFELNISVQTVSTYRSRLMQKLNIKSNAELIRFALAHGIDEAAP
jgi:DNA-binding NarL/FixJ family response regulator